MNLRKIRIIELIPVTARCLEAPLLRMEFLKIKKHVRMLEKSNLRFRVRVRLRVRVRV